MKSLSVKQVFTSEQLATVMRVTDIVKRVCGLPHREAFKVAKNACVFYYVPRRYAAGKTAARGYN